MSEDQLTVQRLAQLLHDDGERGDDGPHRLHDDELEAVRRSGRRQRRTRRALVAVTALITVATVGGVALLTPLGGRGGDDEGRDAASAAPRSRADGLTPLQEQVLREVPGAERLSSWQVGLPEPAGARSALGGSLEQEGLRLRRLVEVGVPAYSGVHAYRPVGFPTWLYEGTQQQDRVAEEEGGAGSGILVRAGTLDLGCVVFPQSRTPGCTPAVLQRGTDDRLRYLYGFGTDDFLAPGAGMEVFAGNSESEDAPTLVVAGIDGDDVERVEFVTTSGDVVQGGVTHDLTVEGEDSIMWGWVPGATAEVVAYDADGRVLARHELRACDGGTDCEVR